VVLRFTFSSSVVSYVSVFQSQNGYAVDLRQKKNIWQLVGYIVGYTRVFRSESNPGMLLRVFFLFLEILGCFDCNAVNTIFCFVFFTFRDFGVF